MSEHVAVGERVLNVNAPKQVDDSALISPAIGPYSLRSVTLDAASESYAVQWRSFRRFNAIDSPMKDPEWLRGYFEDQTSNISIHSLHKTDGLCGMAGFLLNRWPLKLHLGALTIASLPLTRLRLLGGTLDFPADKEAYDLLFGELAASDVRFDAIYMEGIPIDSFLWQYLHESELIRKSFLPYCPELPSRHPILRFEGSFERYLNKFSSKHRKNLLREVRKIREGVLGPMRFVRFGLPAEVSTFLEQAVEISRKTYQWKLHNRGLSATDLLRKRLLFAAERGWMRSYLLYCGNAACAFLVGYQHGGRFLFDEIGFDPTLSKYSVGTVLQLLAIEDMFNHDRPELLDLGDYGQYKEMLSTESYVQAKIFLFRRSAYARIVRAGHRGSEFVTRSASSILERWNLRSKLRRRLRGWNRSH